MRRKDHNSPRDELNFIHQRKIDFVQAAIRILRRHHHGKALGQSAFLDSGNRSEIAVSPPIPPAVQRKARSGVRLSPHRDRTSPILRITFRLSLWMAPSPLRSTLFQRNDERVLRQNSMRTENNTIPRRDGLSHPGHPFNLERQESVPGNPSGIPVYIFLTVPK